MITNRRENINIVNSCQLLSLELAEMKSRIYGIESAHAGMWLQLYWNHLSVVLLEKIAWYTERVCKIQLLFKFVNHYPNLARHITWFSIDNGKCIVWKHMHPNRRKWAEVPILEERNTINNLPKCKVIHIMLFYRQHQTCRLHPTTFVHPI